MDMHYCMDMLLSGVIECSGMQPGRGQTARASSAVYRLVCKLPVLHR